MRERKGSRLRLISDKVHASGADENNLNKVVMTYLAGKQSFLIIEEKSDLKEGFKGMVKVAEGQVLKDTCRICSAINIYFVVHYM